MGKVQKEQKAKQSLIQEFTELNNTSGQKMSSSKRIQTINKNIHKKIREDIKSLKNNLTKLKRTRESDSQDFQANVTNNDN